MTNNAAIQAQVQNIINQGGNPKSFRNTIARLSSATVEEVDLVIAADGAPVSIDAEVVAQNRIHQERQMARRNPTAYRTYTHEE